MLLLIPFKAAQVAGALCARLETDYPFIRPRARPYGWKWKWKCECECECKWATVHMLAQCVQQLRRIVCVARDPAGPQQQARCHHDTSAVSAAKKDVRRRSMGSAGRTIWRAGRLVVPPYRARPDVRLAGAGGAPSGERRAKSASRPAQPRDGAREPETTNRKLNGLSNRMLWVYLLSQLGCSTTRTGWLDSLL